MKMKQIMLRSDATEAFGCQILVKIHVQVSPIQDDYCTFSPFWLRLKRVHVHDDHLCRANSGDVDLYMEDRRRGSFTYTAYTGK